MKHKGFFQNSVEFFIFLVTQMKLMWWQNTGKSQKERQSRKGNKETGNYNGMTGVQNITTKYPGYQSNITEEWHRKFQKLSLKE